MKKVIFTVSAIVCLALSAMFVSCNTAAVADTASGMDDAHRRLPVLLHLNCL